MISQRLLARARARMMERARSGEPMERIDELPAGFIETKRIAEMAFYIAVADERDRQREGYGEKYGDWFSSRQWLSLLTAALSPLSTPMPPYPDPEDRRRHREMVKDSLVRVTALALAWYERICQLELVDPVSRDTEADHADSR